MLSLLERTVEKREIMDYVLDGVCAHFLCDSMWGDIFQCVLVGC